MSKNIRIELTNKELAKWTHQTADWAKRMNMAGKNLVNDLSQLAKSEMEKNYSSKGLQTTSGMSFEIEGNDYSKITKMVGAQAIYTEFGTGTEGQNSPHPQKQDFDLNAYNSGEKIKKAQSDIHIDGVATDFGEKTDINAGELYWVYINESGKPVYTQGIPAQKIVYDAVKVTKREFNRLAEKRLKEALEI